MECDDGCVFCYGNRRRLFFAGHVAFSCAVVGIDLMRDLEESLAGWVNWFLFIYSKWGSVCRWWWCHSFWPFLKIDIIEWWRCAVNTLGWMRSTIERASFVWNFHPWEAKRRTIEKYCWALRERIGCSMKRRVCSLFWCALFCIRYL